MAIFNILKEYLALRKCDRGKHEWVVDFPGIWFGSYISCKVCGIRDVFGSDIYGPAAWPWVSLAVEPPNRKEAIFWDSEDWDQWIKENVYGCN